MSENTTVDIIIKLVVYGVPALLIILGFLAYMSGYAIQAVGGDSGNDEPWNCSNDSWNRVLRH